MGYTLTIGEAKPCPPDPSDEPGGSFTWDVDEMSHDDAPRAPNDANPGANFRWPSYGVWADFARDVGLYDIGISTGTGRSTRRNTMPVSGGAGRSVNSTRRALCRPTPMARVWDFRVRWRSIG